MTASSQVEQERVTTGTIHDLPSPLAPAADGRRENGRWKRGTVRSDANGDYSTSAWIKAVHNAGVVLDYKPDLAAEVVCGNLALDAASNGRVTSREES